MQKVDRKKPTWQLTPMPQFLFPPLLCATICGPPPSSPPFSGCSPVCTHTKFARRPVSAQRRPSHLPVVPPPPPPVACPPLPPVGRPPPPRFRGKCVRMCHHWRAALPRFTPLPGLHPPPHAGAPPLPRSCRRGIRMHPDFRAAPPPIGMRPLLARCPPPSAPLLPGSHRPPFVERRAPIGAHAPFSVPTISTCKIFI